MRYRQLSPDGDYTFGQGALNFYVNSPEAVGQAVETRLLLMQGEWFLDITAGTPYATEILGKNKQSLYDQAIRQVILDTEGVVNIQNYSSYLSPNRSLTVQARINTLYGVVEIAVTKVFPQ